MTSIPSNIVLGLFFSASVAFASNGTNDINLNSTTLQAQNSRPFVVEIIDAKGQSSTVSGISAGGSIENILNDLKVTYYPEDMTSVFPEIKMGIGGKITLRQAPDYILIDGKKKSVIRSWKPTIGEIFTEKSIELGVDDKVNFAPETEAISGMEIKINRVSKTTVIEPEIIAYKTVRKENPNVEKGNKTVLQKGENGNKNKFYLVIREDGEQISKTLTKTETTKEPTQEIVEVGTKIVVLDQGKATWYIRTSQMLAASNTIPKGTKVKIVNLNNGKSVVATTSGGGIYHADNVVVDLSTAAFEALGATLGTGKLSNVRVEKYYPED